MNQCRAAGLSGSNLNVRVEIIPQVTQIIAEAPKGKALPMFEAEAKARQKKSADVPNKGATVREIIPEPSKGKATEKAAATVGVNPRYVSDAKNKKAAPIQRRLV
jgi:hypothetical protein